MHDAGVDVILASAERERAVFGPEEAKVLDWFAETAYLDLGHICNQRCAYCWQHTEKREFVPLDVLEARIRLARHVGIGQAILIGGEPLLYPDWDGLMRVLATHGMVRFGLMSNGTLLGDQTRADRLYAAGWRYCQLSLDSPRPEVQNRLANNPELFDKLMAALATLGRFPDVALDLNAVVCRENVDHLPELVRALADWRERFGIRPVLAMVQMKSLGDARDATLRVSDEQAAQAIGEALDWAEKLDIPAFARNLPAKLLGRQAGRLADRLLRVFRLEPNGVLHAADEGSGPRETSQIAPPLSGEQVSQRAFESLIIIERGKGGSRPLARPQWEAAIATLGPLDRPLLLRGAEPVLHPELPAIIASAADSGADVWLETSGIAFTAVERMAMLKTYGLTGIRLVHLPWNHAFYRQRLTRVLSETFLSRVLTACRDSGLVVEHCVVLQEEAPAELERRLRVIRTNDAHEALAIHTPEQAGLALDWYLMKAISAQTAAEQLAGLPLDFLKKQTAG